MPWRTCLLAILILATAPAVQAQPRLDTYKAFPSHYVSPRTITVWLPDACQTHNPAAQPCHVLYMLDGQNVFTPSPYSGADWGVADVLPGLIATGKVPPVIVVAIDKVTARNREYMPQKVYDHMPAAYQARIRAFEDGETPQSDAFLKFLVTELKPFIDTTYATVTGPQGTAIMGSSMGAHLALYAQGEYPDVFGASASLSMPWLMASWAKNPSAIAADRITIIEGWRAWLKTTNMQPGPNRIYTDQGTVGLDAVFTPYAEDATTLFLNTGWSPANFTSRVFPGAQHSETDWRQRIAIPLQFLLNRPADQADRQ